MGRVNKKDPKQRKENALSQPASNNDTASFPSRTLPGVLITRGNKSVHFGPEPDAPKEQQPFSSDQWRARSPKRNLFDPPSIEVGSTVTERTYRVPTTLDIPEKGDEESEATLKRLLSEDINCVNRCLRDHDDRFPTPNDPPQDFAYKRNKLLNKMVPISIVPLATSNAMLTMGSMKTTGPGGDCYFPLPQYLIWAGATSLSLVVLGVVARQVLDWLLEDKYVSYGERTIVCTLEYMGTFMAGLQACTLLSGNLVIIPNIIDINLTDREQPNYCDRSLVIFSVVFFSMTWFFVAFAGCAHLYIRLTADDINDQVKAELLLQEMKFWDPTFTPQKLIKDPLLFAEELEHRQRDAQVSTETSWRGVILTPHHVKQYL